MAIRGDSQLVKTSFELRAYQRVGVADLRVAYGKGFRAPLYVLPTGGGKTAVFSYISLNAQARGNRVVILVHRQELLLQASRSLERLGVPHGLVAPGFARSSETVQIASVQTLVRRLESFLEPDLIVIDEAHHATSSTYRKILERFPGARILGVTATPCRSDSAGLGARAGGIFDTMILGPSIGDLIRDGFLCRPIVYAPPVGIDLAGVHKRGGDYDKRELGERIDRPKITGDAVEHYVRLARGEPAIAFCVSVKHAEHVAQEFRRAGIRAVSVDGGMDDKARREAIEGLGNGKIDVVSSADLIGEGVDVPRVSVALLLRPTQSLALYLQQCGRALRIYNGKSRALILDHVGNTMRHGFVDDSFDWSLDLAPAPKGRRDDEGLVRVEQCEKCYFVYEAGPEKCPACGHAQIPRIRKIEIAEGELEQLNREALARARRKTRTRTGPDRGRTHRARPSERI